MISRFPFLYSLFIALTLGLAPFSPEPHLLGKMMACRWWNWNERDGLF